VLDGASEVVPVGNFGLLVRWSEVEYLEIAGDDDGLEVNDGS
jgi:hypothetical protein